MTSVSVLVITGSDLWGRLVWGELVSSSWFAVGVPLFFFDDKLQLILLLSCLAGWVAGVLL